MSDGLSQEEINKFLNNLNSENGENSREERTPVVEKVKFKPLNALEKNGTQRHLKEYGDTDLRLSVELGKTVITLGEVIKLKGNSVIKLERMVGDNVSVLVNDRYFAQGEIVIVNDNFGVRITAL